MDHLADRTKDSDLSTERSVDSTSTGAFRRWLIRISRFGLAALFLFTAVAKLATVNSFAANVSQLLSASGINLCALDVAHHIRSDLLGISYGDPSVNKTHCANGSDHRRSALNWFCRIRALLRLRSAW